MWNYEVLKWNTLSGTQYANCWCVKRRKKGRIATFIGERGICSPAHWKTPRFYTDFVFDFRISLNAAANFAALFSWAIQQRFTDDTVRYRRRFRAR